MQLFGLKNRPLTLVVGFNLVTLLFFITAPIKGDIPNLLLFFFFSLFCQGVIVLGYHRAYSKFSRRDFTYSIFYDISKSSLNLIFSFYSLTFLIKYAYLLKFDLLDIEEMANYLIMGIIDPQVGYNLSIDSSRYHTIPWSVYYFISILNQTFFIIGFIKWDELGKVKRFVFVLFIIIELFYWMGRGTNFGIIGMITTVLFSFFVKFKTENINIRKTLMYLTILVVLFFGSVYIFSYNLNRRSGSNDFELRYYKIGVVDVDRANPIFLKLSKPAQRTYLNTVSYLTQGYYNTCIALDLEFTPTYFLGNNPALISLASVFHLDVWEKTYMYKLKAKGVDPLKYWHSAYLWYASDVSFIGVPLIMYILGYFFGISWALCVHRNDFLSAIMFIVFGNMLLYLFANNSYLASVFYSFMFLLPVWYFTRVMRLVIRT